MNDQNLRNKWTEENLTYLKFAYLKGSPLKQIAARLNRSVTAINKVLARHNLRTHNRMERFPIIPLLTPKQIKDKRNMGTRIRKKNSCPSHFHITESRQWVLLEQVVNWLESQNIRVIKSNNDAYYEINGYPKTKSQILMIANSLRDENHLPIFFVEGITSN